jgi:hypothetical protein
MTSSSGFVGPLNKYIAAARERRTKAPDSTVPPNLLGDQIVVQGSATPSDDGIWICYGGNAISGNWQWQQIAPITSSSSGTGLTWQAISTSTALAINNGYSATNTSGVITLTLPTTSALGSLIEVVGSIGCSGFIIQAGSAQQFIVPNVTTSLGGQVTTVNAGVTGTASGLTVTLLCTQADTYWSVNSSQNIGVS